MKIINAALIAIAMLAGAHKISNIEVKNGWVNLYDETGKKYKSLNANTVGTVLSVSGAPSQPGTVPGSPPGTGMAR